MCIEPAMAGYSGRYGIKRYRAMAGDTGSYWLRHLTFKIDTLILEYETLSSLWQFFVFKAYIEAWLLCIGTTRSK